MNGTGVDFSWRAQVLAYFTSADVLAAVNDKLTGLVGPENALLGVYVPPVLTGSQMPYAKVTLGGRSSVSRRMAGGPQVWIVPLALTTYVEQRRVAYGLSGDQHHEIMLTGDEVHAERMAAGWESASIIPSRVFPGGCTAGLRAAVTLAQINEFELVGADCGPLPATERVNVRASYWTWLCQLKVQV